MENQNQPETQIEVVNKINYVFGDATKPGGSGFRIIPHVCNDIGGWGRGFVLALSKIDPRPEKAYKAWYRGQESSSFAESGPFALGAVQVVPFSESGKQIYVANMIGQRDIVSQTGIPPVRYEAIEKAMAFVADIAIQNKASIHAPMFGSGLAGGKWEKIAGLIQTQWIEKNIPVTVYKF